VQLDANAKVVLEEIRVSGPSSAAVIVGGETTGAITRLTFTNVEYGLVIADTAAPTLTDNDCQLARAG
jgi:hypothetical protein